MQQLKKRTVMFFIFETYILFLNILCTKMQNLIKSKQNLKNHYILLFVSKNSDVECKIKATQMIVNDFH